MEHFKLFRISLIEQDMKDLFKAEIKDRREFINTVFSNSFKFEYRSEELYYVPLEEIKLPEGIIIGRIGRLTKMQASEPPSAKLIGKELEIWRASLILIDPSCSDDGQKISFQHIREVGNSKSILQSMAEELNIRYRGLGYHIEIQPTIKTETFWSFVNKHKGNVDHLSFTFIAPNMFGSKDEITKEMRRFRDIEKAQKVSVELFSDNGLNTDTRNIKVSVEYISKAGGKISAKAGSERYNSADSEESVGVEKQQDYNSFLEWIKNNLSKIFGRK